MLTEWGKKKKPLNILNVEYKDKSELFLFAHCFYSLNIFFFYKNREFNFNTEILRFLQIYWKGYFFKNKI